MIELMKSWTEIRTFSASICVASLLVAASGCGTNKFQQELKTESAAIGLAREMAKGNYDLIATEELKKLLGDGQEFVLVDAMPAKDSYDKGHLQGAVNFDFPKKAMESWNAESMGNRTLADYEKLLGPNKSKLIVVYCGFVKCARSHNAAIFARQLGYTNVKRYPGGLYAWKGAGHPLTTD